MAINANGTAGGLGILWDPLLVSLQNFCSTHFSISGFFQIVGAHQRGFLSNVYGLPQSSHKTKFIASLHALKEETGGLPWVLGGEFNII